MPPVYQTEMLNLGVYFSWLLKQQSMGRYVAPIEHIILILSQAVFIHIGGRRGRDRRYDNVTLSSLLLPARVKNRSHST
jgi:hypothetical protein